MYFSSEDLTEYTLRRKLRKNGAVMENIVTISVADDRFQNIKFDSEFLRQLLAKYRPALCIFDPIQAFVPSNIKMCDRNAMRNCLSPLIGYGKEFGTTFIIVVHANKQSGVWGRKRMSDSSDVWDIARSVIMAGETSESGIRYLSQEKNNYELCCDSVLFSINDNVVSFKCHSAKKDRDFVLETARSSHQAPQREEAEQFIINFLNGEEKEVRDLDEAAAAMSISKNALKNAKTALKNAGKIKTRPIGFGKDKKFLIYCTDTNEVNE